MTCKPVETQKSLQNKLFHDSPEDALTTDVLAAGGWKKVGHHLRPDLTPDQAAAWLRACLNVERNEKLSPGQVIDIKRLAKEHDSTATIDYESQLLSYRVEWITPEDELNELQHRIANNMESLQREIKRANDLMATAKLRAVR